MKQVGITISGDDNVCMYDVKKMENFKKNKENTNG